MTKLVAYFLATRPWSLTLTVVSVLTGALAVSAEQQVEFHVGWLVVTLLAASLLHLGGNVLNDYFDAIGGVDREGPATTESRQHPVLSGLLAPRVVLAGGLALIFVGGAVLGLWIVWARSLHILLWFGAVGVAGACSYSMQHGLKSRALGEPLIFLLWGPLMVQGTCLAVSGTWSLTGLLLSPLVGLWATLVLFANNIRDIDPDRESGIKTLAMLLGRELSLEIFKLCVWAIYFFATVLVVSGAVTPWLLLTWLSFPQAINWARRFSREVPSPATAAADTAQVSTIFGVLLLVALAIQSVAVIPR